MYGKNNEEAEEIASIISSMENRIMVKCNVSGDSIYEAILCQISHKKEKYKPFEMRKQLAYYLCKYPDIFKDIVQDYLKEGESFESFALNMFQGLSYPVLDVICAIVVKMWNTPITVVSPKGVKKFFYNIDDSEVLIVIVWNGLEGVDCQYTATKPNFIEWRLMNAIDWSAPVKIINNVKAANDLAEKLFRKRNAEKIQKEYHRCSEVVIYMKDKLVTMYKEVGVLEKQVTSMKTKIKECTADIYKVEKSQNRLLKELKNLGVHIAKFSKPGQKIVPGFQQLPHDTAKLSTATQESENIGRVSEPSNIGVRLNPFIKLKRIQFVQVPGQESVSAQGNPQQEVQQSISDQQESQQSTFTEQELMDTAEQETPQTTDTILDSTAQHPELTVMDVVTPDLSVVKTVPPDNVDMSLWLPTPPPLPTAAAGTSQPITYTPIFPYVTEGVSSVGSMQTTPQVVQAGVVSPQAAVLQQDTQIGITPQRKSTRWGRVLKGQHSFVCMRCRRPFTTKSDTIHHYESNCPLLPPSLKKTYKCADCGQSTFTSKQYLKEHVYEKHKQEFLYFCKACGKGFYKHLALNFHKKNCLAYLRS